MTVFSIRIASSPKVLAAALFLSVAAMAAVTALVPVGAHAQTLDTQTLDTQALVDRIDRLERDIRTLNQQLARMPAETSAETIAAEPAVPAAPKVEFTEGEGSLSRVMVRLDALEQEVRTATGQSESMSHGMDQLNARLDKLVVDLDFRLSRLEGVASGSYGPMGNAPTIKGNPSSAPQIATAPRTAGVSKAGDMPAIGSGGAGGAEKGTVLENGLYQPGAQDGNVLGTVSKTEVDKLAAQQNAINGEAGVEPGVEAAPQGAATAAPQGAQTPDQVASAPSAEPSVSDGLPTGSVNDRYKFAFNLTRQARYEEAEIAFKAFIKAHGEDALAGNAHYWLGETYYVRKDFMQAAQAFFEAYQKFPSGVKAPDSLLKLGMSMSNMEKPEEACTTYGKLRREFSGTMKTPIEQALNRETKRLKCK